MSETTLVLEPRDHSPDALRLYEGIGKVELCPGEVPSGTRPDVTILVVRLAHHLNPDLLGRFPSLRFIVSPTTALNHVDLAYCRDRGIRVVSLQGESEFLGRIPATAELTFGLLLAVVRRIPLGHSSVVEKGLWDRNICKGRDLSGMILGILGFGRVGRQVAGFGRAFGMAVLAHDSGVTEGDLAVSGVEPVSKKELFSRSDVISVHVNHCPENEGIVGSEEFRLMKTGSYFINTSRGELINEPALQEALESGRLAGAGLDVLDDEQALDLSDRPLLHCARKCDNLVITPHIGGCTLDSMGRTEAFVAEKLLRLTRAHPKTSLR